MNWSQHVVGVAIAFLIATVLTVSSIVWAIVMFVGGQPHAHEILEENVITFAFLAITEGLVMLFFWATLIIRKAMGIDILPLSETAGRLRRELNHE